MVTLNHWLVEKPRGRTAVTSKPYVPEVLGVPFSLPLASNVNPWCLAPLARVPCVPHKHGYFGCRYLAETSRRKKLRYCGVIFCFLSVLSQMEERRQRVGLPTPKLGDEREDWGSITRLASQSP